MIAIKKIIKNGRIAAPFGIYEGDILAEDGIIKKVGVDIKESCDEEIDAMGMLIIPGGVDVHTHFNLHAGTAVAVDDFYSGTIGAACGGTTTIVDHMGFGPRGCSLHHQAEVYHGYADGNAVIDYGFHGVIQHVNDDILNELESMINEGIPSFKIYLTYDFRVSDVDALLVMKRLRELHGIITVHCENHGIVEYLRHEYIKEGKTDPIYHAKSRPPQCEGEAVGRMTYISSLAGDAALYVVHLTTSEGLSRIKESKDRGQKVYAETCPQYLLLDEERYNEPENGGLKYIVSPPLRKKEDQGALWRGIRDGYIDTVATDHCPFLFSREKQLGKDDFTKCPNGAPGVEERMPLLFSEGVMKGKISLERFIEVCCTNPAKIFGMYPRKGTIEAGSDCDLVIIDPDREITMTKSMLHGNCDYTAYEGMKLRGYPVMTISRGEVIVKNNEFIGERGRGQFIKRAVSKNENLLY